jgi:hypothetical protein
MAKLTDNTVLLFYKDYETDRFFRGDRYLKRIVRPLYNRLHRGHKTSGIRVAYERLVKALALHGMDVRSNDYALARRNPRHPVGLFGYSHLLDGWKLPNPAVLGVGMYDHPRLAPRLMEDPRYRLYLVPSDWVRAMFEPYYGERCRVWFAGTDLAEWADTRGREKTTDVLVYDKIHWNRHSYEPEFLEPITASLARRGLRTETLRYGQHDHATYRAALARSRALLYLGEHETQGFAVQEALASNVPVLAWDNGFWLDPQREAYGLEPVRACSVPYFSGECGDRFRGLDEFDSTLDRFWARLGEYEPRRFVSRELSLRNSAELYMGYYREAGEAAAP